ncbi:MAG: hypothetical protein FJY73_04240 [Candidatus Eisenbacteria bacterium]|nr:hypothetical protein [Candidatus Eisenbacteria bacterium]
MSRRKASAVLAALLLLFLAANPAEGFIRLPPGPGPTPVFDPTNGDTDPDDFPVTAPSGPTAEFESTAEATRSVRTFARVLWIVAGFLPR